MSEEKKAVSGEVAAAKKNKAVKKNKKPNAFVRFFRWFGKKTKEMWSELKNVTWPKMPKVVKQTGVVLGVILVFLVLITAIDAGLGALLKLLVPSSDSSAAQILNGLGEFLNLLAGK